MRVCVHCGKALTGRSPGRGLCWPHYRDREIRLKYKRFKNGPKACGGVAFAPGEDQEWRKTARRTVPHRDYEPTAEEVERVVAEQMANLPAWWADECDRPRPVYVMVQCK